MKSPAPPPVIDDPNDLVGQVGFNNPPGPVQNHLIQSLNNSSVVGGMGLYYMDADPVFPYLGFHAASGGVNPAAPTLSPYGLRVQGVDINGIPGVPYRVKVRSGAGDGNSYEFAPKNSALVFPASLPSPSVALDITECVGLIHVSYRNPSGSSVVVNSSGVYADIQPSDTLQASGIASGKSEWWLPVRGDNDFKLRVSVSAPGTTCGTDPFVDLIQYPAVSQMTTFGPFPVNCDAIVPITCTVDLPPSPSCSGSGGCPPGRIIGQVDMIGENENWIDRQSTLVEATKGPFNNSRFDSVEPACSPGCPSPVVGTVGNNSAGSFALENLLPSSASSPAAGYEVRAVMNFGTGRHYQYFATPRLQDVNKVQVACGTTVDLANTFVMHPGIWQGDVFMCGPKEESGVPSSPLRYLVRDSDPGYVNPNGLPQNLYLGKSYVRAPGSDGAEARAIFDGEFVTSSSDFVGSYRLALGGLSDQPTQYSPYDLELVFSNEATPGTPETYFRCSTTIGNYNYVNQTVTPGQTYVRPHRYGLSLVTIKFQAKDGTLYYPSLVFNPNGNGRFDNTFNGGMNFENQPADYVTIVSGTGTPVDFAHRATEGMLNLAVPEGQYTLVPSIQAVNAAGTIDTHNQLAPIHLTVQHCQWIGITLELQLNLDRVPECATNRLQHVSGTVASTTNVVSINYELNGVTHPVCNNCGVSPSFNFDVLLADCENTLKVIATDADGRASFVETTIDYDPVAPVLSGCPNVIASMPPGTNGVVVNYSVSALDNCDGPLPVNCVPPSGSFFPVGSTPVSCTATDACGNVAICSFNVIVSGGNGSDTNCCAPCTNAPVCITNLIQPNVDTFLANNLCLGTNPTLSMLFPNPPPGTSVKLYHCGYTQYVFDDIDLVWLPSDPTLSPGQGFVITIPASSPPFTWIRCGCIPDCPPPCLPITNCCVLVGKRGPGPGTWDDLSSCPPTCGTEVQVWTGTGFTTHTYTLHGWSPSAPLLPEGQAAWVCRNPSVNCGSNCCDNCTPPYLICYTNLVQSGINFLANNLCQGTNGLALDALTVPDGTQLFFWNVGLQAYQQATYYDGFGWADVNFNQVNWAIHHGQGFVLDNPGPAFSLIICGCLPGCPPPCLPPTNGLVLVGRYGVGPATWADLSSCPPECGDQVLIWNGSTFTAYDYLNGSWTPPLPLLTTGRSVFVQHLANTNCVACTNDLVINGSFESPVMTLNYYGYSASVPGWTAFDHNSNPTSLELWNGSFGAMSAEQGQQHLEINSLDWNVMVSQVITNVSTNCPATFCFWYVGRPGYANNTFVASVVGSGISPVLLNPPVYTSSNSWQQYCVTFIPNASTLEIRFTGASGQTAAGAHIDNVSLTQCCSNNPCSAPLIVNCPTNKTVDCSGAWSFNEPTASSLCCGTNITIAIAATWTNGFCPQMVQRIWQVTDCLANSATCTQTVAVVDMIPPMISQCATNLLLMGNTNCLAIIPDLRGQIVATDNCGPLTITQSPIFAQVGAGTHPVVFTVYDGCTNWATCTNYVTVTCPTNCCAHCPAPYPVCYTNTVATGINFLANNLCQGTNGLRLSDLNVPDGTVSYRWSVVAQVYIVATYDSGFGGWVDAGFNPIDWSIKLGEGFILDNPGPAFSLVICGCNPDCPPPCLPPASGYALVGRYGVGPATWSDLSSCPPQCGDQIQVWNGVTFVAYDFVNGAWTPAFPVITTGQSVFVHHLQNANCDPCTNNLVINGSFETPLVTANNVGYPASVTGWTATDASGSATSFELWNGTFGAMTAQAGQQHLEMNSASLNTTVSQVITNVSTNCPARFCFWYTGRPGYADNTFRAEVAGSGLAPVTNNPPVYTSSNSWLQYCVEFVPTSTTLIIKFTGLNGGAASSAHIDNVSLTQCCSNTPCPASLLVTCPTNKSVECGAAWTFDPPTGTNRCCGANAVISILSTTTNGNCPRLFQRVWQIVDCYTNVATCTQTVAVVDTTGPILSGCTNLSVTATNGQLFAPVNYSVTATDACNNPVSLSCLPPPGQFPIGTTTVNCVAVDACNNTNTCQFTVTVSSDCPCLVATNAPAPVNDLCASALPLSLGVTYGSTLNATPSPGGLYSPFDPMKAYSGSVNSPDVWYTFSTPCPGGVLTLDTCLNPCGGGGGFDTVLTAYVGNCQLMKAQANSWNSTDCPNQPNNSRLKLKVEPCATYYIRVSGVQGAAGCFALHATFEPAIRPLPTGDNCGAKAPFIRCNAARGFQNCAATTSTGPSTGCSFEKDRWFRIRPECSGLVSVSTCGSYFDTVLGIYTGGCGNLTEIACNDDATAGPCAGVVHGPSYVSFNASAGTVYYLRVGGANGLACHGLITVVGPNPPLGTCPPENCSSNKLTRLYTVSGTASGIGWSWCLSSPCCFNLSGTVPAGTVAPGQPASALVSALVASINSVCPGLASQMTGNNTNKFKLRFCKCGTCSRFDATVLRVGPAGAACDDMCVVLSPKVLTATGPCVFNPAIAEVELSGEDCNQNGEDDTIDILEGVSPDVDENGVPDGCPIQLRIYHEVEDGEVSIHWAAENAYLEQSASLLGPWEEVPGALSPHVVESESTPLFYRLRLP